ncbi:MAG: peptide chain release factor 1 [Pseudomonadota bacterium]|nr:peptide chain release factor 1 [Pseudomonadota bacterium]
MEDTDRDDGDLYELDRLLNDPDVPMQAARVWELLDRVSSRQTAELPN